MVGNLPVQLTRFIGRQREIGDVKRLLAETRLLTLTGPGGSGKTRLAMEVAAQLEGDYQDDAVWVDLASISDESLVAQAVATALRVAEQPGRSVNEAVADFLKDKQLLLILDNCEHLVTACAELVERLLPACPDLRVLATSRESLALGGERIYLVPALSFPAASALAEISTSEIISPTLIEALAQYESIHLFLDRAAAVVPDFALTPENAGAIAAVCHRLDGMPLAIELAAARVNVLAVEQIAGRLDDQFALLISSKRGGIAGRHQSLRAAIDWSYALLTPAEQTLLQRLSVFAGGCSLATAEAICTGDGVTAQELLILMSSLVNKSLVVAETMRRGEARYSLLETIRQYAQEKLVDSGAWSPSHDRHLQCFLRLIEETEPKLRGEYQQLWLDWLEVEHDNIRAALSWSLQSDQIESGLRIAIALYQFWTIRDYREEGLSWYEQLLAQANEPVSSTVHVKALSYASLMASFRGRTDAQMKYVNEAVAFGEAADAKGKQALALAVGAQAYAARKAGDHQTALILGQQEIQLRREVDDPYMLGLCLCYTSFMATSVGDYLEAHAMLDEGLPLLRKAAEPYRLAMALNFRGDLARCERNYAKAVAAYQESISLLREIEAARDLASALHNQGHAWLHLGDVERARTLFKESMAIHEAQQNRPGMTECLLGFAGLAIAGNSPAAAARLLAAAEAIGGRQVTAEWAATRQAYEYYLGRARDGLTEIEFLEEQAIGRHWSLEQAVSYAHEVAGIGAAQSARKKLDELTPREREVAVLVAQAWSNGEIAEKLVVSKRTVETHVSRILAKLGLTSRAQIVRWAIESGLLNPTEESQP